MKRSKLFSLFLALALALSLTVPAFAADEALLTRGELVEALYHLSGEQDAAPTQSWFDDVSAEGADAQIIRWAVESGVVKGYGDGTFGPNDPVTREQMAAMLYRYAQKLGQGFRGAWAFPLDYPDADTVSDWADEPMHWVVMRGIIVGTDAGRLEPLAAATDGQLSLVLERWQKALTDTTDDAAIDYLALVNKTNALPADWEESLQLAQTVNSVGDTVEAERTAYEKYLELKADLEQDGVYIELDSAYRSVAAQQEIMDRFTEKYGADYAAKTVAQPGYSEHHTGLALDLYFRLKNADGSFTDVYYNEDMEKPEYKGVWDTIHAKLAEHGFILRYLEGMEHVTGYRYEPWHIRYVGSAETAYEIMSHKNLTLEEYLAGTVAPEVTIDCGGSALYTEDELYDAALLVKCKFASFALCELHSLRYAGDACNSAENVAWLNELDEGANYTQVAAFLSDFHSPVEPYGAWEADTEYTDYQWWLARGADGGWQLLSWGY